ncbi:NEAT domain-containing protein [Sporosarcina sp. Sa2YVA2]|uniref:NEAT domain-containing protein n=1 Tax=Sporosarcina quadrami TaxID=2762234 RepID=A0ABR8UAR7_9BACL|nr:NEAT domain-containing protein [Sporosarcina quadrami]MBD7984844.1 NEAT domain-containing protein [Sporosarcina quadrami]
MNTKKSFSVMIAFLLAFSIIATVPMQASAATTFADGEYTVPFTVLKDKGNEVSTTADYMVSPAKVHIQNDKATVTVTLNNSSWWQYFKVNGRDVQVISENTGSDKRVVKFDVADLNQLVNAKIHIIVTGIPGFNYDNEYDIRFKFNTASIPAPEKPVVTPPAKEEKPPAKPVTKPEVKPETKPQAKPETKPESKPQTKPEAKPESKPSDKKEEVSKTEDKGLVVEKEEKAVSEKEEDEKADSGKTETDSTEAEDDATVEEDPADSEIEEEVEVDEEPTIEESAVGEVDSDKDESSNMGLFITLAVVLIALIAGLAAFFASKKRARK